MKLSAPIRVARSQGRLGLILYPIVGFPDADAYERQIEYLDSKPEVSLVEVAIPVAGGYSDHANQLIRRAHARALDASGLDGIQLFDRLSRPTKPSLLVLYSEVLEKVPYEELLRRFGRKFEGIVLEWDAPDPGPYAGPARAVGVEIIQCVGPWMEPSTIQAIVAESEPGGLVYLMSAPMTGGELFGADALQRCIESAAKRRDDLSYAAGFGIRTGADVRKLCEVGGLDAVIVGTAYLEAAGKSQAAVEDLVEELAAALA